MMRTRRGGFAEEVIEFISTVHTKTAVSYDTTPHRAWGEEKVCHGDSAIQPTRTR